MKSNRWFKFSVYLNILFIISYLYIGYRKRDKIYHLLNPNRTYRIVMFGNSLTSGGNWNEYLRRQDIKNSGYSGFTTSHFAVMTNSDVMPFKPKICFIEGGMNDIVCGIPKSRIHENYTIIVDSLLKYNIKPVIQSTLYCVHENDSFENSNVDSLNSFLRQLAASRNIHYLDLHPVLSKGKHLRAELSTNGYHLTEEGYRLWAAEVRKILAKERI